MNEYISKAIATVSLCLFGSVVAYTVGTLPLVLIVIIPICMLFIWET